MRQPPLGRFVENMYSSMYLSPPPGPANDSQGKQHTSQKAWKKKLENEIVRGIRALRYFDTFLITCKSRACPGMTQAASGSHLQMIFGLRKARCKDTGRVENWLSPATECPVASWPRTTKTQISVTTLNKEYIFNQIHLEKSPHSYLLNNTINPIETGHMRTPEFIFWLNAQASSSWRGMKYTRKYFLVTF